MHQFSTGNNEIILILTDNFIALCDNPFSKVPTHFLQLNFSVKFETLYQTYNLMGVIYFLNLSNSPNLISQNLLQSNFKRNNAHKRSQFTVNMPIFLICGHRNWRKKSIKGTSTNSSRPKEKSEKEPSPQSTLLKDSKTIRWSL